MKYNYLPLNGKCKQAIKNNICGGCQKLEDPNFQGTNQCKYIEDPKQEILKILEIQEKIK